MHVLILDVYATKEVAGHDVDAGCILIRDVHGSIAHAAKKAATLYQYIHVCRYK